MMRLGGRGCQATCSGLEVSEALAPYRLKVVLVENKRVNGKVKQETIAQRAFRFLENSESPIEEIEQ